MFGVFIRSRGVSGAFCFDRKKTVGEACTPLPAITKPSLFYYSLSTLAAVPPGRFLDVLTPQLAVSASPFCIAVFHTFPFSTFKCHLRACFSVCFILKQIYLPTYIHIYILSFINFASTER
jgi:hypothetical protein